MSPLVLDMETRLINNCNECPHQLINGVACDWQPGNCKYHKMVEHSDRYDMHKHSAWAMNVAEENEYDAVKSFS